MLYNVYNYENEELIGSDLSAKEVQRITGIRSGNVAMYADKNVIKSKKYRVELSTPTLEQLEEWDNIRKKIRSEV